MHIIDSNTCDNIIHPNLYKDKLSNDDFNRIKPLFCVQSLDKTKIFSSHMRPLCLIKNVAKYINFFDFSQKNL